MDFNKIEEFLNTYKNKIEEISKDSDLVKRFDEIRELALKIESLLTFVYPGDKEKAKNFMENYSIKLGNFLQAEASIFIDVRRSSSRYLIEILGYFKRVLGSMRDYIELKKGSEKDLEIIEKIEKNTKFQKAEAERREAVKEAKEAGATIELIQTLRDELKRKSQIDIDINEIKSDIKELKEVLNRIKEKMLKS